MATGAPQFAASGTERGRGVLRPAVVVEIVPSTEVRPQAATAICSASTTTVASCRLPIDRPINRREVRSIAARERVEVADRELSDSLLTERGDKVPFDVDPVPLQRRRRERRTARFALTNSAEHPLWWWLLVLALFLLLAGARALGRRYQISIQHRS
jgi:hypothetical protein